MPVVAPPRLFASVEYWRAIANSDAPAINAAERYDKRCKAAHRYEIVDVRGRLSLTVPIAKPHGVENPTWADCPVSTHDEWWRRHRTALESAYGRTPYFEFLIDKFNCIFRSPEEWDRWPSILDLIRVSNGIICDILYFDRHLEYVGRLADFEPPTTPLPAYWQVRQHIHGFQPGLSILDLIFNLGPEAAMYIR